MWLTTTTISRASRSAISGASAANGRPGSNSRGSNRVRPQACRRETGARGAKSDVPPTTALADEGKTASQIVNVALRCGAYRHGLGRHDDGGFAGDVTGRLGYAWGTALIYAKGGFAFLDVGNRMRETVSFWMAHSVIFDGHNNNDNFVTGWTVGGGLEWKVGPSWSIKTEYLHFDFSNNNNDNCCNDGLNNFRNNAHLTADTVKLGFNYFWNAPPVPLK